MGDVETWSAETVSVKHSLCVSLLLEPFSTFSIATDSAFSSVTLITVSLGKQNIDQYADIVSKIK